MFVYTKFYLLRKEINIAWYRGKNNKLGGEYKDMIDQRVAL